MPLLSPFVEGFAFSGSLFKNSSVKPFEISSSSVVLLNPLGPVFHLIEAPTH